MTGDSGEAPRVEAGTVSTGPATQVRDTPLDEVPAYLREGGVLVLGESDVDTLVPTADPEVVDASDRSDVRRVLAFGDATGTSTAADPRITLTRAGCETTVTADGAGGVERLRYELRLPDADTARAEGGARGRRAGRRHGGLRLLGVRSRRARPVGGHRGRHVVHDSLRSRTTRAGHWRISAETPLGDSGSHERRCATARIIAAGPRGRWPPCVARRVRVPRPCHRGWA